MKDHHFHKDESLESLREQIDSIDARILDLINQRLLIGKQVGSVKSKKGGPILDRSREKSVLEKLAKINKGPAQKDMLRYLFSVIITATRQIQKPNTISFLGPSASFTHISALNFFKHCGTFVQQESLYDIFRDVEKGQSHYGVVPVENSIEGVVNHTLDLFMDFSLRICGEHYEPISHDLLSITGEPGDVQQICSHPQALAQCRGWIKKKFSKAVIVETSSTSKAAQMASENNRIAAIASSQAGQIYELQVVESKIEDYSGNITRFLVLGNSDYEKTGDDKTSLMFATSHVPGALFKALEPVNRAGLNMLKLESRPSKKQNWTYTFFVDIEGHMEDELLQRTVKDIGLQTLDLKILGSYPKYQDHPAQPN
ncbi:MAG: prephenate dehydratase [Desulfobacteraceae bacterium]|nr:MAG: prephenate dehydratase [Desulfobacteraceae bacterium]